MSHDRDRRQGEEPVTGARPNETPRLREVRASPREGISGAESTDQLKSAFKDHYAPLLRLCRLLTETSEDAEDLAQEAFLRLAPKLTDIDPSRVRAYLRSVAVNTSRNNQRRLAVEGRWFRRWGQASTAAEGPEAINLTEREIIWQWLLRMPHRQRCCLVLRYYEDLSEREIAEVLGCAVGTVKSTLSQGLTRLRKEYDREH